MSEVWISLDVVIHQMYEMHLAVYLLSLCCKRLIQFWKFYPETLNKNNKTDELCRVGGMFFFPSDVYLLYLALWFNSHTSPAWLVSRLTLASPWPWPCLDPSPTYTNLAAVSVVLLLVSIQQARKAKVGDLDVVRWLDQHVAGGQVPVHQPPLLKEHHTLGERKDGNKRERSAFYPPPPPMLI